MLLSNSDMDIYINSLNAFLDRSDIIGYAAARNVRILSASLSEYYSKRDELIKKYGELELDKDGNHTGRYFLTPDSSNFKTYIQDITPFSIIKHEVTIFKIPYSEVIGKLTGSEILEIDWMLDDSDNPIEM